MLQAVSQVTIRGLPFMEMYPQGSPFLSLAVLVEQLSCHGVLSKLHNVFIYPTASPR